MVSNNALYAKILHFEPDDPSADLTYTRRLIRENGWTLEYGIRVVQEYKKFIYLVCVADVPLTPSADVDQAWHLHLLYTRSYWEEFCGTIIGRPVHHGPTLGGAAEGRKYLDCYAQTLHWYRKELESEPPADIWPAPGTRFAAVRQRWVNLDKYWMVPKFRIRWKG